MQPQQKHEQKQYLAVPEIFTYEYFQTHRYDISQKFGYQCLCNNGFIKLYTLKTRVYWHAQNQFQHRVPDWKFHVSVKHSDVRKAWDLIVGLFLKKLCRAGMKVIYLKQAVNPNAGRQITIYIVKYCKQFDKSSFAGDFEVSIADEHSQDFWKEMVIEIEQLLAAHQIQSNGLADGDLKIGTYVSLRNEAFVLNDNGNYIYPPNQHGWNPQNHKIPFNLPTFIKQIQNTIQIQEVRSYSRSRPMYYFTLPFLFFTIGYLCLKKLNHDL